MGCGAEVDGMACPVPCPSSRPWPAAVVAAAVACAGPSALATAQPGWVDTGGPGTLMQYFIDSATVRRQGDVTYYRLHGRGSKAESRQTTVEAEVGVDCRQLRRVEYISTTRWQDGFRTGTGSAMEPVQPGSRHWSEVETACRLADAGGAGRQPATATAMSPAAPMQPAAPMVPGAPLTPAPLPAAVVTSRPEAGAGTRMRWSATGFAVSRDVVVTNNHVVEGCGSIQVQQGRTTLPARLVAADRETDLAALSVPGASLPALELAGETQELGESVTVLGYPLAHVLGSGLRVTTGIVSALSGVGGEEGTMQISAAVQSGNSGGPVLDPSGAVAGVVVKKLDGRFGAENIGFAVRMQPLRRFLSANGVSYVASRDARRDATVAQLVRRTAPSVLLVTCA